MDEVDMGLIGVRADQAGFAREVAAMRATLEGSLGAGADAAGRRIETALVRAARTGKLGFEELKATALSVLEAIAAATIRRGLGSIGDGGMGGGMAGGMAGVLAGLLGSGIGHVGGVAAGGAAGGGAPGRATGGPVSPGRAYLVGERGPELFVPTASGRVETGGGGGWGGSGVREVRVAITVHAAAGVGGADALGRSSRQVARAVRAALAEE